MLRVFTWTMMLCLAGFTWAASSAATAKKPVRKATPKKIAGKGAHKSASKAPGKSGAGAKAAPAAKKTTWRNRQMAPTPDRYREIQQALATKGYLSPENTTGAWNQSSIDALRRFQADQNIESTGKINSLSLIALGLGPKREPVATKPPVPPPPPGQ